MKVRLVSITKPVLEEIGDRTEDLIAYCARVSNPSNQTNNSTADKLLKYCADKRHWSVFEMADLTMEIETTRDIARQILRHRSFSFQEFSQRYAEVPAEFELREARLQDHKNRQNSLSTDDLDLQAAWDAAQKSVIATVKNAYRLALDAGIAKEQARAVLPEGMTLSRMYMKGSVRSWVHYCAVRMDPSTQKEHRLIAQWCWEILTKELPFLNSFDLAGYSKEVMTQDAKA